MKLVLTFFLKCNPNKCLNHLGRQFLIINLLVDDQVINHFAHPLCLYSSQ